MLVLMVCTVLWYRAGDSSILSHGPETTTAKRDYVDSPAYLNSRRSDLLSRALNKQSLVCAR